jgi:hypothetical protein
MNELSPEQRLNQVLIRLYRSLLQYTAECWPWLDAGENGERQTLQQMAADQQAQVGRIVELLLNRGANVEFDNYPTEYTDLHYVALDYLLGQLIADEEELLAEIRDVQGDLATDREAVALLRDIAGLEQEHLQTLRTLASQASQGARNAAV